MCANRVSQQTGIERDRKGSLSMDEFARMQNELTSLADTLGRKWNLVILHRLLRKGPLGFSELLDDIEEISSKVLSESLDDLEESGFVDRTIVSERPFRVQYSLTQQGTALESLIDKVHEGSLTVN